ncbi:MAG: hypothetical protein ACFB50_01495 [Rubrobacteraceae bacterium]
MFLLDVAIVSTSIFGLLSLLFGTDPAAVKARSGVGIPIQRLSSFFMVFLSLLFAFMWSGMVLASGATGTAPDEVPHSVVIIDLPVMLPLLFFGGVWQRRAWGHVLGGLLLTKAAGALLLLVPYLRGFKEVGREPGPVVREVEGGWRWHR